MSQVAALLGTRDGIGAAYIMQMELGRMKLGDGTITAWFRVPKALETGDPAFNPRRRLRASLDEILGRGAEVDNLPTDYDGKPAFRIVLTGGAAIKYEVLLREWERADNDIEHQHQEPVEPSKPHWARQALRTTRQAISDILQSHGERDANGSHARWPGTTPQDRAR